MSTDQPYNALGQILATGGDQSVALAMDKGWSQGRISLMLSRRYGSIDQDTYNGVVRVASDSLIAGDRAFRDNSDGSIPLAMIPVNSELFGDENEGQRTRWIGEVEFDGGTNKVLVYGTSPGIPTPNELHDAMVDMAMEIGDQYRGKFGLADDADLIVINVRAISIIRKF